MSSARCGYFAVYSVSDGRSPRRWRWANSSASCSTGLRSALESAMYGSSSTWEKAGHARQDLFEPLQRPDVAVAGRRLLQSEDLRRLAVAQLLEVAQDQHFAVD